MDFPGSLGSLAGQSHGTWVKAKGWRRARKSGEGDGKSKFSQKPSRIPAGDILSTFEAIVEFGDEGAELLQPPQIFEFSAPVPLTEECQSEQSNSNKREVHKELGSNVDLTHCLLLY